MPTTRLLLLVEDEEMLLALLDDGLTEAGFEVVLASSGQKAIDELEVDAERFGGLITDIRLGSGPDGWTVAHRARELRPHIPVIYMSGDSGHKWDVQGVPNSLLVSKPFAVAQIVTAISTLLVHEDTRRNS